jgi:hypothetical protein
VYFESASKRGFADSTDVSDYPKWFFGCDLVCETALLMEVLMTNQGTSERMIFSLFCSELLASSDFHDLLSLEIGQEHGLRNSIAVT